MRLLIKGKLYSFGKVMIIQPPIQLVVFKFTEKKFEQLTQKTIIESSEINQKSWV